MKMAEVSAGMSFSWQHLSSHFDFFDDFGCSKLLNSVFRSAELPLAPGPVAWCVVTMHSGSPACQKAQVGNLCNYKRLSASVGLHVQQQSGDLSMVFHLLSETKVETLTLIFPLRLSVHVWTDGEMDLNVSHLHPFNPNPSEAVDETF